MRHGPACLPQCRTNTILSPVLFERECPLRRSLRLYWKKRWRVVPLKGRVGRSALFHLWKFLTGRTSPGLRWILPTLRYRASWISKKRRKKKRKKNALYIAYQHWLPFQWVHTSTWVQSLSLRSIWGVAYSVFEKGTVKWIKKWA